MYQTGSLPGVPGAPGTGLGAGNSGCQTSGGYVSIPGQYLNLTGPLTLLAWTRANPAGGVAQTIFSKGVESFRLTLDGSGFPHFADGSQPGGDLIGPARIDDGQWHFLAGTFNGVNTESLYVDGHLAAANGGATTPINGNTDDVWLGGDPGSGTPVLFNGVVDEPAILTNALSAAQVLQLYNAASTPLPAPPSITSAVPAGGPGGSTLNLTWSSIAGQRYQVQYKTSLNQSVWTGLVIVPATGSTTTAADALNPGSERFYRIALLP